MADIVIAEMDFSAGLRARYLVVPPMLATVKLQNPSAELKEAIEGDRLITQKLIAAAYAQLQKSKKQIQAALKDFDQRIDSSRPTGTEEVTVRTADLNMVCRQITQAQAGLAEAAVMAAWQKYVAKKREWAVYRLRFACRIVWAAVSVAVSVVAAVFSVGILAATIVGAARTCMGAASDIKKFARSIDSTANQLIAEDLTLSRRYGEHRNWTGGPREIAAALGVPFVKSVKGMQRLLTEFNAKIGAIIARTDALFEEAKKLIKKIEEITRRGSDPGPKNATLARNMETKVTQVLDTIHELAAKNESNETFYEIYRGRHTKYVELKGRALGAAGTFAGVAVLAAGLASTIKTVVDLAGKLA